MATGPDWETIGPPPLGLFATEQVRALRDLASGRERRKVARRAVRGDGHAVLVLPGLLAGDFSTAPLRGFLRDLCYDARGWKLGINRGPEPDKIRALGDRLEHLCDRHGRRISLIGWSLGGIFARELARARPDRVRLVISMGSPFRDISATHATRLVPLRRGDTPHGENRDLHTWLRQPLDVPTTSIYSRTDGIVHWQSCLEEEGPERENIEVDCSHTGMGFHPTVLEVIADRLGQPEGEWHPYADRPSGPKRQAHRRAS
ncbi:MAG: alpha/beta hydrolase [bacterium]|nr:alpha/beta hydrolase [bacterium]MCP5067498.1 alpha/beta hydrolase [bacterium]